MLNRISNVQVCDATMSKIDMLPGNKYFHKTMMLFLTLTTCKFYERYSTDKKDTG